MKAGGTGSIINISSRSGRQSRAAAFSADIPLKRFDQPGEVAALAVLLASDEATFITGAELSIDGGLLAGSVASPG